ncbi:MAG: TonB-dependent receptor [Pseudooceanicola nanhaiensis]
MTIAAAAQEDEPFDTVDEVFSPDTEDDVFTLDSEGGDFPVDTDDDVFTLDAIQVQGLKYGGDFVDTPASVSAIDSYRLEETGVSDLRESFQRFGNVSYFGGGSGNTGFVIRGLSAEGVTESSNTAPLSSVIVDGTSQTIESMRRGARGIWDVDQIEIYRGPQSTIQGRGALSGAVIVETNDPSFVPERDFRLVTGNHDRLEGAFVLGGPIVDGVLAYRLSGESRYRDLGITYNDPRNLIFGEDVYRNLRGKLLFQPANIPGLSFLLTVSDTFDRPGILAVNGADYFAREYTTNALSNVEGREGENLNVVLESRYQFANGMEFVSVSSWLRADTTIFTPAGNNYQRDASWQDRNFTQDFRLTFGTEDTEWSGLVGLFYGHYTQPRRDDITYDTGPDVVTLQNIVSNDDTTHISVYGDAKWRFAPSWTLNFGGRLLHEEVTDRQVSYGALVPGDITNPANFFGRTSDTVFLPKLGVTYHFSEDRSLSAFMEQGYRSGFNAIQAGGATAIEPEYLTSFEIAYRDRDPGGAWRYGANLFYSRYTDQQVTVGRPSGTSIPTSQNAGKSEMYGAELEGEYLFSNGVTLWGSLGLLQTRFLNFQVGNRNYDGNEFPESPNVNAALGVVYEGANGVFASLSGAYTGKFYSTGAIDNDPNLLVGDYWRWDARVGYRFGDAEVALFADNLFDTDYITSLSGSPPSEAVVSEARTVGVELRVRF